MMLIRYYITSLLIAGLLLAVGQIARAILPGALIIIIAMGSLQSTQPSIQSLQQLAIDNIMLLSRIALMIGVVRLMNLAGYNIVIASVIVSIITVAMYCLSLALDYQDGSIVRHQSSMLSILGVIGITCIQAFHNVSQIQGYFSVITLFVIVIVSIFATYWIVSRIFDLTIDRYIPEYVIVGRLIIIPLCGLVTIFIHDVLRAVLVMLMMYVAYGRGLHYYQTYLSPKTNTEQITLDLILKGYKTPHIRNITKLSYFSYFIDKIQSMSSIPYWILTHTSDIVMMGAYAYLVISLLGTGILISDFILYCLCLAIYATLSSIYQTNSILKIDNLARVVIIIYLSILAMMMTIFADDPLTGSSIGLIRIVLNAVIAAQYHSLDLADYLSPTHLQRWIRANTLGAVVIVVILTQLRIDTVMMIPLLLVVIAVLGFTIAQSHITLRKISSFNNDPQNN